MQHYRIYVRLKSGGQATGRDLHNGLPPPSGVQLDVPLITGRTVQALIGSQGEGSKRSKRSGRAGPIVTDVYADQV
jgi:hypothetical protein